MPLDRDLLQPGITPLIGEVNIAGQPGGGPLAPLDSFPGPKAKRFNAFASVVADGAGRAVISFDGPTLGFAWLVERITVRGGGSLDVYVDQETDAGFVEATAAATEDVADETSPIYVPGGQKLIFVFTAAGAGTLCRIRIQVQIYKEG